VTQSSSASHSFREARDLLLRYREDYATAKEEFAWPRLDRFNWALDWFDVIAAEHPGRDALRIVAEGGSDVRLSYAELAARSNQVANWLRGLGVRRGDPVLLMLGNIAPLWEVILAAIKLGAVVIPATTLLGPDDIADRIVRGGVRHVITESAQTGKFRDVAGPGDGAAGGDWTPVAVGEPVAGWRCYSGAAGAGAAFEPDGVTQATDPLLLYFTSGTTAQPKLVQHTHASYPAGHLSTMYWLGLQPGDVHLNVSSPGWAKHAWS
jgi:acetyl-CoA synthetase